MLRTAFVSGLLVAGALLALRGPFEALLLYLWLAYFRPEQWVWTDAFQSLPISFAVGTYLLARSLLAGVKLKIDLRTAIVFLFLALALVSTVNSRYESTAWTQLSALAKSLVISYLLALLTTDASRIRVVVQTIAISLAFEGAKQGWAQLVVNPGGLNENEVPFLGDNNGVAVGMLMLVPLFIALGRTTVWRAERWVYWFLGVGVLYRAISTYSRGGFLAAGALALVFALRSPHRMRAVAGGTLAAALVFSVLPASYWDRMNTITVEDGQERDFSSESRLFFWQVAIDMAQSEALGVGPGAYPDAYDRFDPSAGAWGHNRAVHSTWFGCLGELGFGGLFLLVAIIALAWTACLRAQRLARSGQVPRELGHFGAAFEAALAVFVVGGSFLTFQYIEMLWHLVGLTMGLQFLLESSLQGSRSRSGAEIALASYVHG